VILPLIVVPAEQGGKDSANVEAPKAAPASLAPVGVAAAAAAAAAVADVAKQEGIEVVGEVCRMEEGCLVCGS